MSIDKIFLFKKLDIHILKTRIRNELKNIKNEAKRAIEKEDEDSLGNQLKLYKWWVKKSLKYYKEGIANENANFEVNSIYGRRQLIKWVNEDFREIFRLGIKTNNKSIIGYVGWLSFELMKLGVNYVDFYIFKQFSVYSELLYYMLI